MPMMLIYWEEAYTLQRKTQKLLLVASKEAGLEVMLFKLSAWPRDQNAGRSQKIKTDNNYFETVEEFKYWQKL